MNAKDGNLRIDQSYKYITCDYRGKYTKNAFIDFGEMCENCGQIITNVVTVEGQNDKRLYRIGLDCAAALTTMNPSEKEHAAKRMRQLAKIHKYIVEDCKSIIMGEDGAIWMYSQDVQGKWESNWKWRGNIAPIEQAVYQSSATVYFTFN